MKSIFEPSEKMRNAMSTALAEMMAMSPAELLALGAKYANSDTAHFIAECNHAFDEPHPIADHFMQKDSGVGHWAAVSYAGVATAAVFVRSAELIQRGSYKEEAMADPMASIYHPLKMTFEAPFASAA